MNSHLFYNPNLLGCADFPLGIILHHLNILERQCLVVFITAIVASSNQSLMGICDYDLGTEFSYFPHLVLSEPSIQLIVACQCNTSAQATAH